MGVVAFGVAAVLLVSMGGAVVAAPVTVPLMLLAARNHPTRVFRVGAVLVSLTVAEVVWALTYVAIGEAKPWIWLLPIAGAIGALYMFTAGANPRRQPFVGI